MVEKFISLLSADASDYRKIIKGFEAENINGYHFDIMDGHFVKNFAFNSNIIRSLRKLTKLPFQAHLEINNPSEFIDMFINSGCQIITVHPQTCNIERELRYIRTKGCVASVAIDPDIDVEIIKNYLGLIDNVVIMAVYPGFGGQNLIEKAIKKIIELKELISVNDLDITISVDGGVSDKNDYKLIKSGANILIYGSSLFK